jgi:Arc/MetJ-type ribon-helix-helix transcriptional regulator
MDVSPTPVLESWVDEKVRISRYASATEVIREALRLLEEQELAKQERPCQDSPENRPRPRATESRQRNPARRNPFPASSSPQEVSPIVD